MKRMPQLQRSNSLVHRERDARSLVRLTAVLLCGLVLAGGFIRAAAQHTIAVSYGYQSEALLRERERLLDERDYLLAERDAANSPARLEQAARRIGLEQARAAQVAPSANRITETSPIEAKDDTSSDARRTSGAPSRIVTAIVAPPGVVNRRR